MLTCVWALRALCYLSVKQYREAVRDCSQALDMDRSNVKALYRRAQAHRELKVSVEPRLPHTTVAVHRQHGDTS